MTLPDWIGVGVCIFFLVVVFPAGCHMGDDAKFGAGVRAPFDRHGVPLNR